MRVLLRLRVRRRAARPGYSPRAEHIRAQAWPAPLRRATASSSPASHRTGAAGAFWFHAEGSDTRPALTAGPAWTRRRP